jgi:hypothetical protein
VICRDVIRGHILDGDLLRPLPRWWSSLSVNSTTVRAALSASWRYFTRPSKLRDLGEAARQNPLSAALIGMGVLWLFTGSRTAERAGEFVRDSGFDRIPDAANDAFEAARSTFSSHTDAIGERITSAKDSPRDGSAGAFDSANRIGRDYADTASEYVSSLPGAGAEMFETVRSNLADVFRAQPLALGAIGRDRCCIAAERA